MTSSRIAPPTFGEIELARANFVVVEEKNLSIRGSSTTKSSSLSAVSLRSNAEPRHWASSSLQWQHGPKNSAQGVLFLERPHIPSDWIFHEFSMTLMEVA